MNAEHTFTHWSFGASARREWVRGTLGLCFIAMAVASAPATASPHQACEDIVRMSKREGAAAGPLQAEIVKRGPDLGEWGLVCLLRYLPIDEKNEHVRALVRARLGVRRASGSGEIYLGLTDAKDPLEDRSLEVAYAVAGALSDQVPGRWAYLTPAEQVAGFESELGYGFALMVPAGSDEEGRTTARAAGGWEPAHSLEVQTGERQPDGRCGVIPKGTAPLWGPEHAQPTCVLAGRAGASPVELPLHSGPQAMLENPATFEMVEKLVPHRVPVLLQTTPIQPTSVQVTALRLSSPKDREPVGTVAVHLRDSPSRDRWWGVHRIAYRAQTPLGIALESLAIVGGATAGLTWLQFQDAVGVDPIAKQERIRTINLSAGTVAVLATGGTIGYWMGGSQR